MTIRSSSNTLAAFTNPTGRAARQDFMKEFLFKSVQIWYEHDPVKVASLASLSQKYDDDLQGVKPRAVQH